MEKSKEYKISTIFSCLALVLYSISIITGLIPGPIYSMNKTFGYLGFSCFCFGLLFLNKSKEIKNHEDK